MKNAVIAAVVAAVVAAASGTAATIIVTSKNIQNGTIQPVDLSLKTVHVLKGRRGATGPPGEPGPQGDQGPPGIQSLRRVTVSAEVQPGQTLRLTAPCAETERVVSGGAFSVFELWGSFPSVTNTGWEATATNRGAIAATLWATAFCASNLTITQ